MYLYMYLCSSNIVMSGIFVSHFSVTLVRFANDDKTRLACASKDGTLTVFSLVSEPPSLACTLRGHTRGVNGEQILLLVIRYCDVHCQCIDYS